MPTKSDFHHTDLRNDIKIVVEESSLAESAIKQKWETPELKSLPTDETQGGFIYATKETTDPPTRLLPS